MNFDQTTVELSNLILKNKYEKYKKISIPLLKDMLQQYEMAEAGAAVFMAIGSGNDWLDSVEIKKRILTKIIELAELIQEIAKEKNDS